MNMTTHTRKGIPSAYFEASSANLHLPKNQLDKVNEWLKTPSGNLLLWGPPGRGKTFSAIAVMYALEKKGFAWSEQKFIELSDFYQSWLEGVTDGSNYSKLQRLKEKEVVVLDDLGVRKPSDGFLEFLYTVINHRTNEPKLITVFTTNLSAKELNELFGPRFVSRMSSGLNVEFSGQDLRQKNRPKELI